MVYPNDADGDGLRRVAAGGSDMSQPMEIDFFIAVPDKKSGEAIAAKIELLGYKTKLSLDSESDEWTCYCSRFMVPTYASVVECQKKLNHLSKEFGGYSDGWGTFGNVESN